MLLNNVKAGQKFKFIDGHEEFTKIDMSYISKGGTNYYFIDKLFNVLLLTDNDYVILLD